MRRVYEARFMREDEFALCELVLDGVAKKVALIRYDDDDETFILSYSDEGKALDGRGVPPRIRGCFDHSWVLTRHRYDSFTTSMRESGTYFETLTWEFKNFHREPTLEEADFFHIHEDGGENVEARYDDYWLIAKNYSRDRIYSGFFGYHRHDGMTPNQPLNAHPRYRFGIELECEFDSEDSREDFTNMESNWFYCESDGSLGENGCEIITIPLLPKDAKNVEFWRPLTQELSRHARSWDTNGRCGLHVHISKSILGTNEKDINERLSRMLIFYYHHLCDSRLDGAVFGRDTIYNQHDGKTEEGKAVACLGAKVLKDKEIKKRVTDGMLRHNRISRYYAINILNEHTFEFRKGKGSLNPERIAMVVEYCELICKYAKTTPWEQIGYDDFVKFAKNNAKNARLQQLVERYQ